MNTLKIDEFVQDVENQRCVDCLNGKASTVSVYCGIFVCEICSNIHKQLNPDISWLKKPEETWDSKEILYVNYGGNSKFLTFLESYKIPADSKIPYKYNTKAVQFYRQQLASLVEHSEFEQLTPSQEEGVQLHCEIPETPESCFSVVSNSISDSIETGKKALEKLADSENLKLIQNKTKQLFKDLQEGVKTKTDQGKAELDRYLEYGRENLEWGKNAGKERILNTVEESKEKIFQTVEKGKEKWKAGVEYSKETVTWGVETGKDTIYKSVEFGRDSLDQGIQTGKKKLKDGIDLGKETLVEGASKGKEKLYEKVESGKNIVVDGIDKGKELIVGSVEKVTNLIVETAENGKQKVGESVSEMKDKISSSVKTSKDTLVHYFSPERPEDSKED